MHVRALGRRVAVIGRDGLLRILDSASGESRASAELRGGIAGIQTDPARQWLVTTGGTFVDIDSLDKVGDKLRLYPCGHVGVAALATGAALFVAACRDGSLVRVGLPDGSFDKAGKVPNFNPSVPITSIALYDKDQKVAMVNAAGQASSLSLVDQAPGTTFEVAREMASIRGLGRYVLVDPSDAPAQVWDFDGATRLMVLPDSQNSVVIDSQTVGLLSDRGQEVWSIPNAIRPHEFYARAGLAGAEISPDGQWVVAASADGNATVWSRDGALERILPIGSGVVKRARFSPDNTQLAVAVATSPGLVVFDTSNWRRIDAPIFESGVRRIEWIGDALVVVSYGLGAFEVQGRKHRQLSSTDMIDLDVNRRGDLVLLSRQRKLFVRRAGQRELGELPSNFSERAVSILGDGSGTVTANLERASVRYIDGRKGFELESRSGPITDLECSDSGDSLYMATLGGTIEVWDLRTRHLQAILQGHRGRVSEVRERSQGELVSASWDHSLRIWNLRDLARPASWFARGEQEQSGAKLH